MCQKYSADTLSVFYRAYNKGINWSVPIEVSSVSNSSLSLGNNHLNIASLSMFQNKWIS